MKILIVEDDDGLRMNLQDILELNGHQVMVVEDGVEGLALAAQGPEFIFCDVDMPNLDGHGLLAEIKQMPGVCDVPFVFLTGRAERDQLREGMALGADDYITKPYSQADILGAIAARSKRQGALREKIQQLTERQEREMNAQWSHELMTPLNAVFGALDLIESAGDSMGREELKEMLGLIREGAERQDRLSRKMIAYYSLERLVNIPALRRPGRCQAEVAITNGARQAGRFRNREADLVLAVAPAELAVAEEWLALAVREVVDNAAVYSPAGSHIHVTGTNEGGRFRVTVSDQGPGLSAEQRAQVGAFTQFGRNKREQQGLGLGLMIARLTVRLAGGEFALHAGTDGRGLRVEFLLPGA